MGYDPFVDPTATYEKPLYDPKDLGEDADDVKPDAESVGSVTLRPLTAGDRAEFSEIKIRDDEGGSIATGLIQLMMVERAIVAWTFDRPPTIDVIRVLEPGIFDQLYFHVSYGNPTIAEKLGGEGRGPFDDSPTPTEETEAPAPAAAGN